MRGLLKWPAPRLPRLQLDTVDAWERALQVTVAAVMLCFYVGGVVQRVDVGVPGYLATTYGVNGYALAMTFSVGAGALLAARLSPFWFFVATLPIAFYAGGAALLARDNASVSPATVGGHIGFFVMINGLMWLTTWVRTHMVMRHDL